MINELLKDNPLLSVALLGALGSIGFALKEAPVGLLKIIKTKVVSRFVFTATIYDFSEMYKMLESWLALNYKEEYRSVNVWLESQNDKNKPGAEQNRIPKIAFSQGADNIFVIKHNGKRILIKKSSTILNHATSFNCMFGYSYVLSGFNAKENISSLFDEVINVYYSSFPKNTIRVKSHASYGSWESTRVVTIKPIDKIFFNSDIKQRLLDDINLFVKSKDWYLQNCVAYKRGFCFYGPPGTGKTSLCLAIASFLKRDVYVLNLKTLNDDQAMMTAFDNVATGSVILLEDFDVFFIGRTAGKENTKVSFSSVLNCIDGAFYKEDVIVCITTNNIDVLDAALLRAGRMDVKEEIDYPTQTTIVHFMESFYGEKCEFVHSFENNSIPMSQVQEICMSNRLSKRGAINEIEAKLFVRNVVKQFTKTN